MNSARQIESPKTRPESLVYDACVDSAITFIYLCRKHFYLLLLCKSQLFWIYDGLYAVYTCGRSGGFAVSIQPLCCRNGWNAQQTCGTGMTDPRCSFRCKNKQTNKPPTCIVLQAAEMLS